MVDLRCAIINNDEGPAFNRAAWRTGWGWLTHIVSFVMMVRASEVFTAAQPGTITLYACMTGQVLPTPKIFRVDSSKTAGGGAPREYSFIRGLRVVWIIHECVRKRCERQVVVC